jgi:hypothetical protein
MKRENVDNQKKYLKKIIISFYLKKIIERKNFGKHFRGQ